MLTSDLATGISQDNTPELPAAFLGHDLALTAEYESDKVEFSAPCVHTCVDDGLLNLGRALKRCGYRFTCITEGSHQRVNARKESSLARNLRDVFGWSRLFEEDLLPPDMFKLLQAAGGLETIRGHYKSLIKYATFDRSIVVHSAWPALDDEAVYFGADSYRFAAFLERMLSTGQLRSPEPPRNIVDLGCGTGVGGILAARLSGEERPAHVLFTDINHNALRFTAVNAHLAGVRDFALVHSDVLANVDDPIDLILSQPPYLVDPGRRAHDDDDGGLGTQLSLQIVRESLQRLRPGGQLVLYTAAPFVHGEDMLWRGIAPLVKTPGALYLYQEFDPDVFGWELDNPTYRRVERIAAVGLCLRKR